MGGLNKKFTIIVVAIIIVICVSMGSYGLLAKNSPSTNSGEKPIVDDNKEKKILYEGKLYFYDGDKLLGTYKCKNPDDYCGYAYEHINDDIHDLDYYADGKIDHLGIINNRFAFIADTKDTSELKNADGVILYDILDGREITTYRQVKNYTIGIENNLVIVQQQSMKWGVIQLSDLPIPKIAFEYDFIGLQNQVTDKKIDADIFVVNKDNAYFLVDINKAKLTSDFRDHIVSYNGNSVITLTNERQYASDYEGNALLNGEGFKKLTHVSKYIGILDNSNVYYIYDYSNNTQISEYLYLEEDDVIETTVFEDGTIEIYVNDILKASV